MKLSFKVEGKMGRMQTKSEIISARSFKDLCIFLLLLRFRLTCLYPNLPPPYLEMKMIAALHWRKGGKLRSRLHNVSVMYNVQCIMYNV